ncbi:MAG: outer membrane beta-barrel protein [Desulfobacteraceae bacterium]|jgi:hypothetical protein|nr:outer membrane beta-barrel protein [Desulfobacteraceae bacterium]
MKKTIFYILLAALFPQPLAALSEEGKYFTTAGAGFLFYTDDAKEKTDLDYAADFEISFGKSIDNHFVPEAVVHYIHDGHTGDDIKIYTISLALMRMFPLSQRTGLFVGGGFVSAFFSKYFGHIYGAQKRDQDYSAGVNLIAGIQFDIGPSLFIRNQLSYRLIDKFEFEDGTINASGISTIIKFGYKF